jgi:mRNA interferase RelE/StbE
MVLKKLKSLAELYRIRVGDYRIIYSIDNNVLIITVVMRTSQRDL